MGPQQAECHGQRGPDGGVFAQASQAQQCHARGGRDGLGDEHGHQLAAFYQFDAPLSALGCINAGVINRNRGAGAHTKVAGIQRTLVFDG